MGQGREFQIIRLYDIIQLHNALQMICFARKLRRYNLYMNCVSNLLYSVIPYHTY